MRQTFDPILPSDSVRKALAHAFWTIKVPSMALLLGPLITFVLLAELKLVPDKGIAGFVWFLPMFLGAFIGGWLVWSIQVPKWRLWAYTRVGNIEELKYFAVAGQILWPDGHFFTKTEICSEKVRRELQRLEQENAIQQATDA